MITRRRTSYAAAALAALLLAAAGARVAAMTAPAAARNAYPQAVQFDPPPGTTVIDSMPAGITFTEMAPPAALPNGQPIIPMKEAVQIAEEHFNPGNDPGIQVSASYGSYSNDEYARVVPSGGREPYFQNHPTWLVRYTGLTLYAVGGVYDRLHPDAWKKDVHHEQVLFIDAVTGEFLGGITYR